MDFSEALVLPPLCVCTCVHVCLYGASSSSEKCGVGETWEQFIEF